MSCRRHRTRFPWGTRLTACAAATAIYDKGIPAEEYAKVQIFAMEYSQSQANPKASFVKDKGSSTLKRIEILGDEGWLDLWTA
jgi:hypothetical protein